MPGRAALLALFAAGLLASAANAEAFGRPRRIVLILLDAARADRFSSYGYRRSTTPAIDELAARGALFLNHYAQGTDTRESLPTLFYSRYVTLRHFPVASMQAAAPAELFLAPDPARVSLPRALRRGGYRTAAISAHLWLDESSALMREFETRVDLSRRVDYRKELHYPPAESVVDAALAWVRRNEGESPWFLYLHLMDTHFPHLPGIDARGFLGGQARPDAFDAQGFPRFTERALTPPERAWLDGLYDGGLRYVDRQLKRLFDRLDELGPREETLIVITADHGERLLEGPGRFAHGGEPDETVAHVPLVISGGGVRPARDSRFSEGVDVAPTVLDLARVALAPEAAADGVSLASYLRRPEAPGRPVAILGRGIRDERFKVDFTMNPDTLFSARRPDVSSLAGHVYDLKNDPGETRDLWSERPDVVLNLLDAYRARVGPSHARQAAAISERTPAFPFALSASWFDLPGVSSSQVSAPMALPRGVQATFDATRAWPLSVSVPDGRYRLSVQVKGKGWITVDGRSSRVSGPPAESSFDEAGRDADLGDVVVTNRRLRLFVQASGSRDLAVLRLGLVPARLPAPDGDLDEKLRALGYLGKVR